MIKGSIVTNKRGKIGWNEGRERSQLSATSIKLRFWWVCVYKAWTKWMWAILSEWDRLNTKIKAFCE